MYHKQKISYIKNNYLPIWISIFNKHIKNMRSIYFFLFIYSFSKVSNMVIYFKVHNKTENRFFFQQLRA